jgi:hypothetical protein
MLRHISRLATLTVVILLTVALSACGGSSKATGSADVVAQVGATPVSKASFDHWMAITIALRGLPAAGQAAVKPTVPEPPTFAACVASRRTANPKAKLAKEQFKSACKHQYEELEPIVLGFLISAYRRQGEAQEQGIIVTDAEAQRQLALRVKRQYPKPGEFQKFLAASDQTTADVLFATRSHIIGEKLEHKVAAGHPKGKATQTALNQFARRYLQKWKSRTTCSPGFVGPLCK